MSWFNSKDKLQIIAFQTYGTNLHLYAKGRALEDENINLADTQFWKLLWNAFKRFESDEVRNTKILLKLPNGTVYNTATDSEGYFLLSESMEGLEQLTNNEGWLSYELSYDGVDVLRKIQNENRFPGEILIPSRDADFGVISDIDDTILHTGVVSSLKWQVIVNTFFKSAGNRIPLEGAAKFYHLLHRGQSGKGSNPIFYVSHSPWNLYRYLEFFLKKNAFPKGPILLRSLSSFRKRKAKGKQPQKQKEILNILKTYPALNFILIGDAGEKDADIYLEIASHFPDRILAIYLRSVNHRKKLRRIQGLFDKHTTTPALLVRSSEEAIAHAREHGFIAV